MRKIIIFITLLVILPFNVIAHPGNTDSSGCHTCRTNCTKWGLSYGEYHCHNAKYTAPVYVTPAKKPVVKSCSFEDCCLEKSSDKYQYKRQYATFYDSKCTMANDTETERWILENGLANNLKDIHKWAYWLIKYNKEF